MDVAIIGHFAKGKSFFDGQTIKTRTLYAALQESKQFKKIKIVDTYSWKRHVIRFLFSLIWTLLSTNYIILIVADNGRRVFFPLLYVFAKIFKKKIFHDAIGARLDEEILQNKNWKKYLNSFSGNWMESRSQIEKLNQLGINNAVFIPNFKRIPVLTEKELVFDKNKPYKFCTFSRVIPEKGIENAIDSICRINQTYGNIVSLDIYGQISGEYEIRFKEKIQEAGRSINYCGKVKASESVKTIKGYYMLLFPTEFFREGIPGTIIDAFSAGVPVIASGWLYAAELICHEENGYIYNFEKKEELQKYIEYAISHENEIYEMKKRCLEKATEYDEKRVVKRIIEEICLA